MTGFALFIIFFAVFSVALVWGYAHEKQIIEFEDEIFENMKRKMKSRKQKKNASRRSGAPAEKDRRDGICQKNASDEYYVFSTVEKYDRFFAA